MNICSNCFNDIELSKFVESNSNSTGNCKYCKFPGTKILELTELLDFISEFLEVFEEDVEGFSLANLIQKDRNLFSSEMVAEEILADAIPLIKSNLTAHSSRVTYIDEIRDSTSYWEILKKELKWKRRFLTNMDKLIYEYGWDALFNEQITLKNDEVFYRARIHKEDGQENYDVSQMSCPSKENTSGGRANPQGIPYLYLSKEVETTFYETRVTYLDEVSVGSFRQAQNKNIVLVDFTENRSIFLNIGRIKEFVKGQILKKLISVDLSLPIRRYDSELEYIPTQFICEFIRYITGANGIIFESSLYKNGMNVVIFEENLLECFEVKRYQIDDIQIYGELK